MILIALFALMMAGCGNQQRIANSLTEEDFGVFVYDSCEYIIAFHGYKGFLSHKGNCRFCKKRKQKELEELVIKLKEK